MAAGVRYPRSRTLQVEETLSPINAFGAPNGFIVALTYSSQCEWVKNVLAAGGCELRTRGREYQLFTPNVVRDPTRRRFPITVRVVLMFVGADEYIGLSTLSSMTPVSA